MTVPETHRVEREPMGSNVPLFSSDNVPGQTTIDDHLPTRHFWRNYVATPDVTTCARCGYTLGIRCGDLVTADIYATDAPYCERVSA